MRKDDEETDATGPGATGPGATGPDATDPGAARPAGGQPRRGPGRPRREDADARRAEIIEAAVRLFAERGFAGTTIEAVALAVGATKRTVYRHFTDKTGLFFAAVERLHAHERPAVHDGADLEEVAARMVHILHGDDAVTLHRLVIAESRQLPQLAAMFYERGPARSIEVLAASLAPRDDAARETAEALYTLLLGEAHRKRLLGLTPAPSRAQARAHARRAIGVVLTCQTHRSQE
ncbi:TetR/AcrR family transcriptional regulator [Promicromonospora sp. NPDC057488]|uniref:TetR/AcrR family transcriptional regulator n=1 Tax=Promicromonospora sp. NPDC057488 TaxID=3346147 RepID=UPI00366B05C2